MQKGTTPQKKATVSAVRNAYFQSFVPDIINLLEKNQHCLGGKTNNTMCQEFNKLLVGSIRHLTGLNHSLGDVYSKNQIQQILEKSRQWYQQNEYKIQKDLSDEMLERQRVNPILSRNYRVAKWALDKAILEKDKRALRLGLKGFSLTIRNKVVLTIMEFDDKSYVSDLIKALESNQGVMSGGSETEYFQLELNKSIVNALRKLTGLKFTYFEETPKKDINFYESPRKDIQKILIESREWCRKNKEECNIEESFNNYQFIKIKTQ